jgi:hypothetical protein
MDGKKIYHHHFLRADGETAINSAGKKVMDIANHQQV